MEFVCRQELYLLQALSRHVDIPQGIIQALQEFFGLIRQHLDSPALDTAVGSITDLRGGLSCRQTSQYLALQNCLVFQSAHSFGG